MSLIQSVRSAVRRVIGGRRPSTSATALALAAMMPLVSLAPVAHASAGLSPALSPGLSPGSPTPPLRVTQHDVDVSNGKVAAAYGALTTMWRGEFAQIGKQFTAPRIARYSGRVSTPCGVIEPNNAQYCDRANAIYYDEVFVAGMARIAGDSLGTDGDMSGIGIIAHEMGHAVAMQLGHRFRDSYSNEATADCLAGAFAQRSERDGLLERGDLEEAIFGMQMAGDPTPESTGNVRYDAMIARRLAKQAHGTRDERVANFKTGFSHGAGGCLAEFRSVG